MREGLVRIVGFNPDGTATTEDGRVWRTVLAPDGALGLVPSTREDAVAGLDQERQRSDEAWPPPLSSLGLDQA